MQNLKRSFLWNTLGSTLYFAAQWLITLLVVRLSGVQAAGLLGTAMVATNVFISLSGFGMRYYQASDINNKFSSDIYVKSRVLTCVVAAVFCVAFSVFVGYSHQQLLCVVAWLFYRMSEPFSDVYNGICQQNDRLDIAGKSYTARAVVTLLVFCVGLALTNNIVLTLLLMSLFIWCIIIFYDIPKAKQLFNANSQGTVCSLLLICAPLAVYKVFETAAASIPKFFLERELGGFSMGIYNSVTSPVLLLQTAASFLLVPLVTVFAKQLKNNNNKEYKKLFATVIAILMTLLPLGLLISRFFGKWGLSIIGDSLPQHSYLLYPMVVAAVLTAFCGFFSMLLTVLQKFKALIIANFLGVIFSTVFSAKFIQAYSMQGATYALILALLLQSTVMLVFVVYYSRRKLEKQL